MYNVSALKIKVKLKPGLYMVTASNPAIGTNCECEGVLREIHISSGNYSEYNINKILESCINNCNGSLHFFTTMQVTWDNGTHNTYGKDDLILSNFNKLGYKSIW